MDKSYLNDLLHRYLKGEASQEETHFIISFYELFQDDADVTGTLTPAEKARLGYGIRAAMWKNIGQEEPKISNGKRRVRNWSLAAAAIFVLFFAAREFLRSVPPSAPQATALVTRTKPESHVIMLADGTSVILDQGSKLSYPSSFEGVSKREVMLTGQAYFDVRHMASKPFIVHAGQLSVVVLGTAFNVRALPAEPEITVTVKRGRVRVSEHARNLGVIIPRQQIVYNTALGSFAKNTLPGDESFRWKDGDLVIDNLTITEAARVLEERFHVTISVSDSLTRSDRFTAIFPRGENLDQALKGICAFNGATYIRNGGANILICPR